MSTSTTYSPASLRVQSCRERTKYTAPRGQAIRGTNCASNKAIAHRYLGVITLSHVSRAKGRRGLSGYPEYPQTVLDEAIVNAVAHRDYSAEEPIDIEVYRDAVVVQNPGHLRQRASDIPDSFSLGELRLRSFRVNPLLLEWLQDMRDPEG